MPIDIQRESRRHFLRFVASSPLLSGFAATLVADAACAQDDAVLNGALEFSGLITSPDQALNVWDFENAIRSRLNAAHYAYLAQGADDFGTIRANRGGFARIGLRPQRLVDTGEIDLTTRLFGETYDLPIFLCPVGAQKMFHQDGEIAVARAARTRNALQVLSTVTNASVEDVAAARSGAGWFQLYTTSSWPGIETMLKRAEDAGFTAVAWTIDIPARNLEPSARFDRGADPLCVSCHSGGAVAAWAERPMFNGVDMSRVRLGLAGYGFDTIERIKNATRMKVLIKGIVTGDDAARCLAHGADGIVVSNHGGRADETLRGAIDSLPEVVDAVGGRVPVLVDSGFRRGTDVFKALALGATAVGIGRPYIWGLGSFGQEGVERVLDLLARELRIVMQQMGAARLDGISRRSLEFL